ncbi:MAG: epoxyqueuosine reductase QueH [Firmicutes bacterium]|nr:epoxyqueuosine reductase QueH [Bacillota bacterium]
MRILLHNCCGPCSCYPVSHLRRLGRDVTGFFFNPNIHPYREFERRLQALMEFAAGEEFELIVNDSYDLHAYLGLALAAPDKERRCRTCYGIRLDEVAREAALRGFDAFSTTLLVSPYQAHESVREAGTEASRRHGVEFHYEDFRSGWPETVRMAREKGLYRQGYCGCVFSEAERYRRRS